MRKLNYYDVDREPLKIKAPDSVQEIKNLKERLKLSKVTKEFNFEELETLKAELHELKTQNVLNSSEKLINSIKEKQNEIDKIISVYNADKVQPLDEAPILSAIELLKAKSKVDTLNTIESLLQDEKDDYLNLVTEIRDTMLAYNSAVEKLLAKENSISKAIQGINYTTPQTVEPTQWLKPLNIFEGDKRIGKDNDFEFESYRIRFMEKCFSLIEYAKISERNHLEFRNGIPYLTNEK